VQLRYDVNGEPALTCSAFLTDYAPGPIRVEPLRNFPVIRDLVVEIGDFHAQAADRQAWLVREEHQPLDLGEYLQTPAQMDEYTQFSMCINCMLCYSACPVYGLDPDFVGPAAIALAQRYNLDSRDQGAHERRDVLNTAEGVWRAPSSGNATTACPKGVDPAGAIQRLKLSTALDSVRSLLFPGVHDDLPGPGLRLPTALVSTPTLHLLVLRAAVLPAVRGCAS